MLIGLLAIVFLVLVVRGFARVIAYFWEWLSGGTHALPKTQQERDTFLDTLHFGWYHMVLLFFIGSIFGLLLEEIFMYITAGSSESRVGLIWGPFSPLYGTGAALLSAASFYMRKKHFTNLQIYIISAAFGFALEELTGQMMLVLFHAQSWTYIYLPDHITQFTAWRFVFIWGALGLIWTRYIMPPVLVLIGKATTKRQVLFVSLLSIYLILDIVATVLALQRQAARDMGTPPQSGLDRWLDTHYSDEFMSNKFQNMVIGKEL